jgi:hypothetical protein
VVHAVAALTARGRIALRRRVSSLPATNGGNLPRCRTPGGNYHQKPLVPLRRTPCATASYEVFRILVHWADW